MQTNPPLNIIKFLGIEHEQLLVSIANNRAEMALISHIQGLYEQALMHNEIGKNEIVLFQLLVFIHYHFLFSNSCLMRCHLSEAYASARTAIDAGLIAAVIIDDRSKQVEYATNEPPFKNGQLNRYLKNLIINNQPIPHSLAPSLLELHGKFSSFASHADIGSFVHRATIDSRNPEKDFVYFEYFQFSQNKNERQIHTFTLLHVYVMLLDIFSSFFITEQKLLSTEWLNEIKTLGAHIEQQVEELRSSLEENKELTPAT